MKARALFALLALPLALTCTSEPPPDKPKPGPMRPSRPGQPPPPAQPEQTVTANPDSPQVRTAQGHLLSLRGAPTGLMLTVQLPTDVSPGSVTLHARIVDAANMVMASVQDYRPEAAQSRLKLTSQIASQDWPLYRLEYKADQSGEANQATIGLGRFRAELGVKVLLGDTLVAGGPAALRVIASEPSTGKPVANARVVVTLGDKELLHTQTTADGTVQDTMTVPEDAASGDLEVRVTRGNAVEVVTASVTVVRQRRILLTTDKPLYQPGQAVHLRALAMKRPALKPVGDAEAVFEVVDPKGNKVFKKKARTTEHGVTHATFEIASEVLLGTYHVRVHVGDSVAERTVEVKRYTLPKFKVSIAPEQAYYLPGETIKGSVDAGYFFGKPVRGDVEVRLDTFDVGWNEAAKAEGKTNASGQWSFELTLPKSLVGQPLQQWQALARLTAKVVDAAGQDEVKVVTLPVAPARLRVDGLVAGGRIVPGLEHELLVLVSTPDGSPVADATVKATHGGAAIEGSSDAVGLASLRFKGTNNNAVKLSVTAKDGTVAAKEITADVAADGPQVLLSMADASLAVGETLKATVLASGGLDRVFVDVIRDGQAILTRTVELEAGRGSFELATSADYVGTLLVQAYHIGAEMTVVRDARPVVVTHAQQLGVALAKKEGPPWKPGEEARLTLTVRDEAKGAVKNAAVGVRIVDEAVFALAAERPGLERLFFALEQELLAPKLEVHGFSTPDLVDQQRGDAAARVLCAAADASWEPDTRMDTAAATARRVRQAYQARFDADARRIFEAFEKEVRPARRKDLAREIWGALGRPEGLADPWGTPYRFDPRPPDAERVDDFLIRSAGPDELFDTPDDLVTSTEAVREIVEEEELEELRMDEMVKSAEMPDTAGEAPPGTKKKNGGGGGEAGGGVRVRQYFPETLYVNPLLITDDQGKVEIGLTMADSITTWRLSATASDAAGRLGTADAPVVVFQDFFVDLDLPESLTQNDQLTVQVAVYNYLKTAQTVELTPEVGEAFKRLDGSGTISVALEPNQVKGVTFRIQAVKVGLHPLTVTARGSEMSDAVRRSVRIIPDGVEVVESRSAPLDGGVELEYEFPKGAIEGANQLLVKLYPGSFSQVVEGLDSLLRMPSGCFEQTSSTTYPNVLALDYMRAQKKVTPEIEAKALSYINQGWQRLLTFEVQGGGFSWFGDAPANRVLTAFGVQEFADMAKVFDIDPAVLERTQQWLAGVQEPDGSWKPDKEYLHADAWGDIQKGSLLVTAYIARALAVSGYQGEELKRALSFLKERWKQAKDAYSLALIGGALAAVEPQSQATREVLAGLAELQVASEDRKQVHWPAGVRTATYGSDASAKIETTALAAYAFMQAKQHMGLVGPALNWLVRQKDAHGTWGSTQPTILALSALVKALSDSTEEMDGKVIVKLDGEVAKEWTLTREDSEVVRQLDLSASVAKPGKRKLELTVAGKGAPLFQVVKRHWLPRTRAPQPEREPAYDLEVKYDRTRLATDDLVEATAAVKSRLPVASRMLILDLAVPPGFSILRQDLDDAVSEKRIQRYRVAGRQLIVYLEQLGAGESFELTYRLRALTPVKAQTGTSRVYQYYEPSKQAVDAPTLITVGG